MAERKDRTAERFQRRSSYSISPLKYSGCQDKSLLEQTDKNEIEVEAPKFLRSKAFNRSPGFVKNGNPIQKDLNFAMFKYI